MKTGYVGYRFLTIYFLFYCAALFLWYITHFSCRWFHQWRRLLGFFFFFWLKVVQVASKAWCRRKRKKVEWRKKERKKKEKVVSHMRNYLKLKSKNRKCNAEKLRQTICSRQSKWGIMGRGWRLSFGVFVCVFFLKPYCNYFPPFFFNFNSETKGCDCRLPARASRTLTRPL